MKLTEILCAQPANFFVASEEQPRLDLRGQVDFDESENTATIVAANALRRHEDISVFRRADLFGGLGVNSVEVSDQHDGSGTANEYEVALAEKCFAFELFSEEFKQLLLRGKPLHQRGRSDTNRP